MVGCFVIDSKTSVLVCVCVCGRNLFQVESVRDVVGCEEGGNQVCDGTSLSAVRAELEGVEASLPKQR